MKRFALGVTGASGSACARSVLCALIRSPDVEKVHVVLSRFALQTLRVELEPGIRNETDALRALMNDPAGRDRRTDRTAVENDKVVLHAAGDMAAVSRTPNR